MTNKEQPRVKLPPPDQVCIVVKDMDRAIEYYSSVFGWGPFQIMESVTKDITYRGRKGDCHLKLAFAQSGPIEIELIQVLEGETPHSDFLKDKGEGLHHLRFPVQGLDGILAELAKDGIEPIWSKDYTEHGISFAYLNTEKIGGGVFELIDRYGERAV